jgi:hypothetical protein
MPETADTAKGIPKDRSWLPLLGSGVGRIGTDRVNLRAATGRVVSARQSKPLALALGGQLRYRFKTPWRNGTTHAVFEPLEFIEKLCALVPTPRAHTVRYHGLLGPPQSGDR